MIWVRHDFIALARSNKITEFVIITGRSGGKRQAMFPRSEAVLSQDTYRDEDRLGVDWENRGFLSSVGNDGLDAGGHSEGRACCTWRRSSEQWMIGDGVVVTGIDG